jgi:hypothetical protein
MKNSKISLKSALIALVCTVALFAACDKKNEEPKSSECAITVFSVDGKTWTISDPTATITYDYPPEAEEGKRAPTITTSPGATVNPPSGQEQDFFTENGVSYTVTAEDGVTTKTYTARATRAKFSGCGISVFKVDNVEWSIIGDSLITHIYPKDAEAGMRAPVITVSRGATIDPPADQPQDFLAPAGVKYTVTSDDGATTKMYTVRARRQYSGCEILSFIAGGIKWNIDASGHISYTYTEGLESPMLAPTITLSPGATINPPGSQPQNFITAEEPVTYTVTAEDGTQKTYTAKATAKIVVENTKPVGGGSDCTWTISGVAPNQTLTIGGKGAMPNYGIEATSERPPWEALYKPHITTVVIEDSITVVGQYTFHEYTAITSVTTGEKVTVIGWGAFEKCEKLTDLTLGNSVTKIGGAAFHNCKFQTLTIPASVETIGYFAFHDCPHLLRFSSLSGIPTMAKFRVLRTSKDLPSRYSCFPDSSGRRSN